MTARAPTAPNMWIDHKQIQPGRNVIPTEPFKIMDDQEWLLLKAEQICSLYIGRVITGDGSWYNVTTASLGLPVKPTDRCDHDADAVKTCIVAVNLYLPSDLSVFPETYEVKVTAGVSADTVTLSSDGNESGALSPPVQHWLVGEIDFETHGADDQMQIEARCTNDNAGAANFVIWSVGLFAKLDT